MGFKDGWSFCGAEKTPLVDIKKFSWKAAVDMNALAHAVKAKSCVARVGELGVVECFLDEDVMLKSMAEVLFPLSHNFTRVYLLVDGTDPGAKAEGARKVRVDVTFFFLFHSARTYID
jgi:hypothetical protein